jgi:predicted TIM-barrel fold metal-dependent hydrolase
MAQSIHDYKKLDFRDGVRDKLFFTNAARLLGLD